ncbi:MAG TPA: hypothetical protein VGX70_11745, partial [Gemmataceae bacterium]|nr:hypothetical protein [Gemmataceae bacterium]
MQRFLFLTSALLVWTPVGRAEDKPQNAPDAKSAWEYRLTPKLREPLGSVVTVQGVVVEGPSKGFEDGPNVRVQRINGRARQDDIQIRITPYFADFGAQGTGGGHLLPRLASGKTFEFEGYETGGFVGVPPEAFKRAGVPLQTSGFHFSHVYKVYKAKKIEAIHWSPSDFIDREALIEGRAASQNKTAYIVADDWQLLVDPDSPWPKHADEKTVEGIGMIRKTDKPKIFRLEKGTTRLV